MFRVKRSEFISRLWDLSKAGSILITGSPGIGKSWTIAQLIRECRRQKRPYLPLTAEDFDIRSVEELATALHFKTDVLTFLRSLGDDPVLIIDGLDALRGEYSQRAFRELIRRTSHEVPGCSIIASVRTFDLQQSEQLQQLFFGARLGPAHKPFTEVVIPPFSERDLVEAVEQVPGLAPLIRHNEMQLSELLQNPFNLQLAVQLLENGLTTDELSVVHSQVQLLEKYWRMRVETGTAALDNRAVLRRTVQAMVDRRTLSAPEASVYAEGQGPALLHLQSVEVLRAGITGRISFGHNILFDYAVARLLLDEETVIEFIQEDSSRTIFYRPSLSFFFHHLWFKDRNLFWRIAHSFFLNEKLPERARVIPAVTICEVARQAGDLDPLLETGSVQNRPGITLVLRGVQALGVLNTSRRSIWLATLTRLVDHLHLEFVNEYMSLIALAANSILPGEEPTVAAAARNLLRWMWESASVVTRDSAIQLGDIGASRVFPIVMRFYDSDMESSKAIVLELLKRFGSPNAGSKEAFWLAHEIKPIIKNDPAIAIEVYRKSYGYEETSDEETSIGPSLVLPLRTNRKQDFSSGIYGLQMGFQYFLLAAPIEAATAAVTAVNGEIPREQPIDNDKIQSFQFQFRNQRRSYISDFSEIWDSGAREYTSLHLLTGALKVITERLSEDPNDAIASEMLQNIIERASFAIVWKRLVEAAVLNPKALFPQICELLSMSEFISAPETTIAVGNLITAAYEGGFVGEIEGGAIERGVRAIPEHPVVLRYEKPESIRNRLLLCIPAEKIRSADLRTLAAALTAEAVSRKNEPYHRMSVTSRAVSTEDWMAERGVDTKEPENAEVLQIINELQTFENKYLNGTPTNQERDLIEPNLRKLQALIVQRDLPDPLSEQARGTLCALAESVLKDEKLPKDNSFAQLCRSIVLAGVRDPSPRFDQKYHLPFEMPSWGSPSPRIEAAQGLAHWLWNWGPDDELMSALRELSSDPVPAVRFQIASGLLGFYKHDDFVDFWAFTEQMLSAETTTGVLLALFDTLGRVASKEPDRVLTLLDAVIKKGLPATERHELTHSLLATLTGLFVVREEKGADDLLLALEDDPLKFHNELSEEINVASHYLSKVYDAGTRHRAREVLERVLMAIYSRLTSLESSPSVKEKGEQFSTLLKLIDSIALRVFFALDVDKNLRQGGDGGLSIDERRQLYFELKPVLELLTVRSGIPGNHYLAPHTAHNLMVTLNGVLTFDPGPIIVYAAAVCRASSALSYQFDPMAISALVELVEHVLADHKEVLRDTTTVNALGDMLDIFVRASWPEAMQLTFKLDQAIR